MPDKKVVVGTSILSAIDEKRKEKLGKTGGNRFVSARLYYPAIYNGEPQEKIKNAMGEMYQNPKIKSGRYPLIIYNHGYGSFPEANNRLCCELVKNGYFVASVGHAYESASLVLADGSRIELDQSIKKRQISPRFQGTIAALKMKKVRGSAEEMYEAFHSFQSRYCMFLNNRLSEWAMDVLCIEKILKRDYSDYIDFDKGIGATGHSFGGNVAYYMCMNYEQFVCGINMDGAIFGEYGGQRMKKAFMQICQPTNATVVSKALLDTDAPVDNEVLEDTTHMGFTDLSFFHKSKWMMGRMDAKERSDKLIKLHLQFFEKNGVK